MGEDMTYIETELTRAQLAARVAELESALQNDATRIMVLEAQLNAAVLGQRELERELAVYDSALTVAAESEAGYRVVKAQIAARVAELERENAELRAKLDAVPVDDITYLWRFAPRNSASQRTCMRVGDWLQKRNKAVQP